MTGIRIEIDIEALIRDSWKQMPRRRRLLIWLMGAKEHIIAEAVERMTGESVDRTQSID